jgi:DNA-binding phage protein
MTPLTRNFKDTVKARIDRDPAFRDELLREGIECFLQGDVVTGKSILRNFINATIGFRRLGEVTQTQPKSLMRMFSETGNPRADNLFSVISHLQAENGISLSVQSRSAKRPRKAAKA